MDLEKKEFSKQKKFCGLNRLWVIKSLMFFVPHGLWKFFYYIISIVDKSDPTEGNYIIDIYSMILYDSIRKYYIIRFFVPKQLNIMEVRSMCKKLLNKMTNGSHQTKIDAFLEVVTKSKPSSWMSYAEKIINDKGLLKVASNALEQNRLDTFIAAVMSSLLVRKN